MDKIIIKGLRLYAFHGVAAEEKQRGQAFVLDITCELNLSKAAVTDNVDDSVNYAHIVKLTRKEFVRESYNTLECAAGKVADAIIRTYPRIKKVTVLLQKPDAPLKANFESVAVEITRGKSK